VKPVTVSDSVTVSVSVAGAVPDPGVRSPVSGVRFRPFFMLLRADLGPWE